MDDDDGNLEMLHLFRRGTTANASTKNLVGFSLICCRSVLPFTYVITKKTVFLLALFQMNNGVLHFYHHVHRKSHMSLPILR